MSTSNIDAKAYKDLEKKYGRHHPDFGSAIPDFYEEYAKKYPFMDVKLRSSLRKSLVSKRQKLIHSISQIWVLQEQTNPKSSYYQNAIA